MNTDEIVKALQERFDKITGAYEVMSALAEARKEEIESLQAQLAASQRRERAAEEDLAQLENDAYHAINGMIGSPCLWCKKAHSNGGECRGVDACEDWKWRGVNQR